MVTKSTPLACCISRAIPRIIRDSARAMSRCDPSPEVWSIPGNACFSTVSTPDMRLLSECAALRTSPPKVKATGRLKYLRNPSVSISLGRAALELVSISEACRHASWAAHDPHARWGSFIPKDLGIISFGGGVHAAQNMRPQPRQWCRRFRISNFRRQREHSGKSLSEAHTGFMGLVPRETAIPAPAKAPVPASSPPRLPSLLI
mmetsp:Transcript_2045/g.4351  ORF Transcript_2045/g.4351 Transcript_2045/m.4351 type:complete len:204 (-) Transcript_2045:223-834(-)